MKTFIVIATLSLILFIFVLFGIAAILGRKEGIEKAAIKHKYRQDRLSRGGRWKLTQDT